MCAGAGVNLPYLGVKHALGESIPPVEVQWGTQMARYWQEVFRTPEGEPYHLESSHAPSLTGDST
jgi:carbamoyl-phosphate synthase large subunit